ncbi:malate synthase [Tribonema minus]|uniref:Malate synthase n=1 Tax=Tribonema minus TaxID=303371 RepID=A0A835YXC1_9STRA|nr:malate synthase [Tribonema minus]
MDASCVTAAMDVRVHGAVLDHHRHILSPGALRFLGILHSSFELRRQSLLAARVARQAEFDAGLDPGFRAETAWIRDDAAWRVRPPPEDLLDRYVCMSIKQENGVFSSVTYMADLEDSTSPTWANVVEGQVNLYDATRGTIAYTSAATGKAYKLNDKTAVLLVRPRGWHLDEAHVTVNGARMSAALFDFGLYFFHNHHVLAVKGSGPCFYLPKMESHLEARLWNDVFNAAQDYVGVERGTIRATALLETITAAFEMDEILYELRDHSTGLNCGRWDYIFSFIKKMRARRACVTPDRKHIGMTAPFMRAYVELLVHTCHKRGAHAMGGMAAQIPVKHDPELQEQAMAQVRADKLREVEAGHDGTWVAHPALVGVAMDIFNEHMPQPNQIDKVPPCSVTASDLLAVPTLGTITSAGLTENVDVCLEYVAAWLSGNGCIPMNHKMEDAATAEISRVQVWQWAEHEAVMSDTGTAVTRDIVKQLVSERGVKFQAEARESGDVQRLRSFALATKLVRDMMTAPQLDEFLTSIAYNHIVTAA